MKLLPFLAVSAMAATPVFAEESRQLDAHEHGVGKLDIAIDGDQIAMAFHAPGADIVGFEYSATSDEDHAAIDVAIAKLSEPLDLFIVADAAGCRVVEAHAELEGEEGHDDHVDHDEEHGHDDHDEEHGHDDHDEDHDDRDEGAHDDHDDHGHDDHDEDGHDDHDHDDHADEAGHSEFHAEYLLTCSDIAAATDINFAYFEAFPNALEVEVQVISETGAMGFEVERDAPTLDLSDMF